ncbi:MAG: FtsX-like permease family protein [Oxalobacter sp.]|nr:MAG: FtsX-like permease family protein [Oxalobacter sp.]
MRASFLFKLSGLILWRSWRATVVLSFMIVSAVAALVFLLALAVGTNDAMIRNSTGLYAGHIAGNDIAATDVPLLSVPGVKQVLVRQRLPVLLRFGKGMEPVDLIGVHPDQEKRVAAYWKKTAQGAYLADETKQGEETIFLSESILKRLQAGVGDSVSVMDRQGVRLTNLKIVGAYKTGVTVLDHGVAFIPARALPSREDKLSVAVFLEADASPEAIVMQYRSVLPSATFATWNEFMPDLKELIDMNDFCMRIVIFLVFAIVSIGTACAFLIFTLKNLREHGIMKAMGFTSRDTALLLLMQIGLLTFCAAVLGALIGAVFVNIFASVGIDMSAYISHNQYFAVSSILIPRLTGFTLFAPPLVAVLFGLLAAVWPMVYVLRKNPADILRSV